MFTFTNFGNMFLVILYRRIPLMVDSWNNLYSQCMIIYFMKIMKE